MTEQEEKGCYICRKHRGEVVVPGGAVYEDTLVYVGHASIPDGETAAYLGAFLIEPKRHAHGLADLNDEEAQRLGLLVPRLSRALTTVAGAEHVYLFSLGHHTPHPHVWIVPRYPGTPREYWGLRVFEWPEARKGDGQEIEALCQQVRRFLQTAGEEASG